ncbi:MAG: flagellar hook-associated protein 3 [Acidobacteria bacterium]|nr:flagellar hook-associated protein 3 [Acidobacteriota bacterium]
MRSTLISRQRNLLLNIRNAQQERDQANSRIGSGYKVQKPSDSPADAAGVVRARHQIAAIQQFQSNLSSSQAELRAVDGALFEATNVVQRAAQLAAQAGNGTQTAASRSNIAKEVDGVYRHLLSIANTVYDGRYVFAGGNDSTPAFVESNGGAVYNGDSTQRSLIFPDGRPAQISLAGDAIFATPDVLQGQGRTVPTAAAAPNPPIGIGLAFSGGLDAVISVDLRGPFVAAAPPSGALAGDTLSVTLTADDGSVAGTLSPPALSGGEDATALAGLLNAEIAANPALDGKVSFQDIGGALSLVVDDSAGTGFSFTSISTGGLASGLEAGGSAGGFSAEEIAGALQQAADQNAQLSQARVRFTAVDGEVRVDSDVDVTVTGLDFARGSSFASGLAGTHRVGGANSSDVFGSIQRLVDALQGNDEAAIQAAVPELQRAIDHLSGAQGFYGGTLRQIELTLNSLTQQGTVQQERLSTLRDADILEEISALQSAQSAEQFALQVAARQQPTLLDVLA